MGQSKSKLFEAACKIEEGLDLRTLLTKRNRDEINRMIAVRLMRFLCEHENFPYPFSNLKLPCQLNNQIINHNLTSRRRSIFYKGMDQLFQLIQQLRERKFDKALEIVKEILSIALPFSIGLPFMGVAFYGLTLLLQEEETRKLKRYIDKAIQSSDHKMIMTSFKSDLDDLETKILAIQEVLIKINKQIYDREDCKTLLISLFYPCTEICQKLKKKDGNFRRFAFYSIDIATHFFTLHFSLLALAKEFGVKVEDDIKEKRQEYPDLLQNFIHDAAEQRCDCIKVEYIYPKSLKGTTLKIKLTDRLTGEVIRFPVTEELYWCHDFSMDYFIQRFKPNINLLNDCIKSLD